MGTRSYGPHTWEVCELCNYDRHRCGGCGAELTHAEDHGGTHYRDHHGDTLTDLVGCFDADQG